MEEKADEFNKINVAEETVGKDNKKMEEAKKVVEEQIAEKLGCEKFDLSSADFSSVREGKLINVMGTMTARQMFGLETSYIMVYVETEDVSAKMLSDAVKKFNETVEWEDLYTDPNESTAKVDKRKIEAIEKNYIDVYCAMSAAVEKSYNMTYQKVALANGLQYTVDLNYGYAVEKKKVLPAPLVVHAESKLVNVSGVLRDYTEQTSYFYVDTLQATEIDGRVVFCSCRARVDVAGVETKPEDAYAKFVAGKIGYDYGFKETYRRPLGISHLPKQELDEPENV